MERKYIIAIATTVTFALWFATTYKKRKAKKELKKRVLMDLDIDSSENAKNIALSISKSKKLYKELIVKVHPDKFLNEQKSEAEELSAKITSAKKNYSQLVELEKTVKYFLNE